MYIYISVYECKKTFCWEETTHPVVKKKISIFQSIPSFCFNPRPALWFFQSPFNHPLLASPKTRGKKDKTKIILVYLCYYTLKSDVTKKKRTRTITPKPCQKKKQHFFSVAVYCRKLVSAPFPAQLEWLLHEVMEMAPPVTRQWKGSTLQATITSRLGEGICEFPGG